MSDEPTNNDQAAAVNEQKVIQESQAAGPQSKRAQAEQKAAADFGRTEQSGKLHMHVKVYSPFRNYFDGLAFSISAENDTGPFDILPKHHNFISLLKPCNLIVRTIREGDKKIIISGGIMHVKANQVIVFLDV